MVDLIFSFVMTFIGYKGEDTVGDFNLKTLNYFEYFISTPAFVGSYIYIYRRLRAYYNNMLVKYSSLMSDEEVRIINRTKRDILIFFLCVMQYLITRVVRVLLIIAIDHK
jgi:hypothetical protein